MNKQSNEVQFVTCANEESLSVLLITNNFHEAYQSGYEYLLKVAKSLTEEEHKEHLIAEIQSVLDLLNSETDPYKLGDQYIQAANECNAGFSFVFSIDSYFIIDSILISISPYPGFDAFASQDLND
jgi:hypothetical protein